MVKELSRDSRTNIFQDIWETFSSFDRFTKLMVLGILLIVLITPAAISAQYILSQHAQSLPTENIDNPVSQKPDKSKTLQQSQTATPETLTPQAATTTSYYVTNQEVINAFNATNSWRAQNGVFALKASKTLTDIAQWKANDMATHQYCSHTDSLGRDPFKMMDAMGYAFNTYRAENIACGPWSGGQQVFDAFKNSPAHNSVMLGNVYYVVGIARAYNAANSSYYWAEEYGGYVYTPVTYVTALPSATLTPAPIVAPSAPTGLNTSTFCQGTASGVNFAWAATSGATYYLQSYAGYAAVNTGTATSRRIPSSTTCTTGPGGCSFSYNNTINWYVKACNSAGCSPQSNGPAVTTKNCSAQYTLKVAAYAHVRSYTLGTGGCMSGYSVYNWGGTASSAPCNAPVTRKYCGTTTSGTTCYVTAGVFAGKNVRISSSDGTSVTLR